MNDQVLCRSSLDCLKYNRKFLVGLVIDKIVDIKKNHHKSSIKLFRLVIRKICYCSI